MSIPEKALAFCRRSLTDRDQFWKEQSERISWHKPFEQVCDFSRLGAIHSVVFAGFAAASLATRIDDAEADVLITADAGLRGGKLIPLKRLTDEAVALASRPPQHVLVCARGLDPEMPSDPRRDRDYATLREKHLKDRVPVEWLESSETCYLLYTSGTTAKPKGIQRVDKQSIASLSSSKPTHSKVRTNRAGYSKKLNLRWSPNLDRSLALLRFI